MKKSRRMLVIERRFRQPIEQLLPALYLDADQSQERVGRQLGVSRQTINGWLKRIAAADQHAAESRAEVA